MGHAIETTWKNKNKNKNLKLKPKWEKNKEQQKEERKRDKNIRQSSWGRLPKRESICLPAVWQEFFVCDKINLHENAS